VMDASVSGYEELDSVMEIETITLNQVIQENNIDRISLFKCDIEGGEYDLIGSLTTEQMNLIDRFLIEFHQNKGQLQGMVNQLDSYGFDCEFYKLDMANKIKVDVLCEHGVLFAKRKK